MLEKTNNSGRGDAKHNKNYDAAKVDLFLTEADYRRGSLTIQHGSAEILSVCTTSTLNFTKGNKLSSHRRENEASTSTSVSK